MNNIIHEQTSPVTIVNNCNLILTKLYDYIFLDGERREIIEKALLPLIQHDEVPVVSALMYLRSKSIKTVVNVSRYQRKHRNMDFPVIPYIQILGTLAHCSSEDNSDIIDELVQIFNSDDITLKEQMCIADIVLGLHTVIGTGLLDIVREGEAEIERERIANAPPERPVNKKTVYDDSQNVHDKNINQTVTRAISHLCEKYKSNREVSLENFLVGNKERAVILKTYERISYDTAKFYGYTLLDIFNSLWNYISMHPQGRDIRVRLLDEMVDMNGYCSTGHASRLINCLQGFEVDRQLNISLGIDNEIFATLSNYIQKALEKDENLMDMLVVGHMDTFCQNFCNKYVRAYYDEHVIVYNFPGDERNLIPGYQQKMALEHLMRAFVKYTKLDYNEILSIIKPYI